LCLAACLAHRGFQTIGVDIEKNIVDAINEGRVPWFEPGLDDLIKTNGGKRLRATNKHVDAIEGTDITVVLVATPSNSDGSFSNRFVENALRTLAGAFGKSSKKYHLFVISSTVMPGSIDSIFIPILEEYSGRKIGVDFDVCYDPDFVALGNVIKGFLQPDLVVIGESSPGVGSRMEAIHHKMCENQPVVTRMSLVSAEIAKVCLNAYITVKIGFANSVANICEKIPGADVDLITTAIGADRRISPYYFRGGMSFGGTCFPRDTRAYISLAERIDMQANIVRAANDVNIYQDTHLKHVVLREVDAIGAKTVGLVGLAFTSNTPVATDSPAVKLIPHLLERDLRVVCFDALANSNVRNIFGSAVEYVDSAIDCLEAADVSVFTLRDSLLKRIAEDFCPQRPICLIDGWRFIDQNRLSDLVRYVPIGKHF
jgi:UDPglucose 6-dehydrogenase